MDKFNIEELEERLLNTPIEDLLTPELLSNVLKKDVSNVGNSNTQSTSLRIQTSIGTEIVAISLIVDLLMTFFKDEYMNDLGIGLCSHKLFYASTDNEQWYCGFMNVHSTYEDSCKYRDMSSGETLFEALVKLYIRIKAGENTDV